MYGCKTWTLLAETKRSIQEFETKCIRKPLHISYNTKQTRSPFLWVTSNLIVKR